SRPPTRPSSRSASLQTDAPKPTMIAADLHPHARHRLSFPCGSASRYRLIARGELIADLFACERVDPAFEVACLAGEEGGVAEGVREQGGALDAGEQRHGQVTSVALAELPKLAFGPVDDERHHRGCVAVAAALGLVELGAERPHRAAVARDRLTH